MTDNKLSPSRSARLLRAKAADLEELVLGDEERGINEHRARDRVMQLTADVALIAGLLADHIDRHVGDD